MTTRYCFSQPQSLDDFDGNASAFLPCACALTAFGCQSEKSGIGKMEEVEEPHEVLGRCGPFLFIIPTSDLFTLLRLLSMGK